MESGIWDEHFLSCSACVQLNQQMRDKVAQNSNISVRSLGSNAPFSAGSHAITRGFVR